MIGFLLSDVLAMAGLGLGLSFLFDAFDGKFARMFKSRSDFVKSLGEHLDSLADFAVFGVVPFVVSIWLYRDTSELPLIVVCGVMFLICSLTRLAVFNVASVGTPFFIGIPTTLSGLLFALYLLVPGPAALTAATLTVLAVLMVSHLRIPRPSTKGLLAISAIAVAVILAHLLRVL